MRLLPVAIQFGYGIQIERCETEMIETLLNLFGLALTGTGAFIASRSVIISEEQAKLLSGTYWNGNKALQQALLAQSRAAKNGLLFIVFGTGLQAVALIYAWAANVR
jgi:hypothetical protein